MYLLEWAGPVIESELFEGVSMVGGHAYQCCSVFGGVFAVGGGVGYDGRREKNSEMPIKNQLMLTILLFLLSSYGFLMFFFGFRLVSF